MRADDELVIHITKNREIYVETKKKEVSSFKQVDAESVLDCLKTAVDKDVEISSGLLPNNCIAYTGSDRGDRFVALTFDEQMADIMFEKTEYKDFPLPRLVFGFTISADNNIEDIRLGVTEVGRLTPRSKMFTYPFSNVTGFNLCTGSNSLPKVKSLHQLNGLPYFILKMPNNYDYYNEDRTKLNMDYRSLLEHLKDKDSQYYYNNVLLEMGKTLNDFISEG